MNIDSIEFRSKIVMCIDKSPKNVKDISDITDSLLKLFKQQLTLTDVVVPKGTLCECKGSGGISMNGTRGRCTKPLEIHKD